VSVTVEQPAVRHQVRVQDFMAWLQRKGGTHAEVMLRRKLGKMLA
jgi:LysM repeat protein